MKKLLIPLLLLSLLLAGCRKGGQQGYEFRIPGMTMNINTFGEINRIEFSGKNLVREVSAASRLADCEPVDLSRSCTGKILDRLGRSATG
ncbi:MAG: hypothetical protein WC865_08465 [Bacteroidales bacterium]